MLEVGDGVARVQGLENVMAPNLSSYQMVFDVKNLEENNVGLVLFGESRLVKEGDLRKEQADS